jgi:hypothetical protein
MATFREIDNSASDKSIYLKDLPALLEYRQELDRVSTSNIGDKLFETRWKTLHKIVCDLIQKYEATEMEKRMLVAQEKLQREQIEETKRVSDESSNKLNSSIGELRKPHWTLTPSFVVIVLTMIFAAIAAWPVIREWFPISQPANKAADFSPPQSNSMPASITKTQAPPVVLQGTNQLAK